MNNWEGYLSQLFFLHICSFLLRVVEEVVGICL